VITRAQITKRADQDGVDARTVERDYVLAHVVALIARKDRASSLAFKGGTCLRLVHMEDCRYSADADYSILSGSADDAMALVRSALRDNRSESIAELVLTEDDPPRIAYRGPLGRQRTVKLDIAADEVVERTESRSLFARWPDLPSVDVLVYTPVEIAGEKLRCVLQRLQCRDILDLSLLFEKMGVDPVDASRLFRHKAKHKGFDPSSFASKFEERAPQYRKRWDEELGRYLVGEVPHYEDVERRLRRALRRAGLL
jgi:predicted nucleotidyltransferase component of viral defense system